MAVTVLDNCKSYSKSYIEVGIKHIIETTKFKLVFSMRMKKKMDVPSSTMVMEDC